MKVKVTELRTGTGPAASDGDWLTVHYVGSLLSTGAVFDETAVSKALPFTFQLGAGDVIDGWESGLLGLKVGGKRRLQIPAGLAYGSRGAEPLVPPDAALQFDIELLELRSP